MSLNNANKTNVSSMITNNNKVTMVKTELENKLKFMFRRRIEI